MLKQGSFPGPSGYDSTASRSHAAGQPVEVPIYVINLDRSPQRFAHITGELERMRLRAARIDAVDANDLDERTIAKVFDAERARRAYFVPMNNGEIACFLSHRRAWQAFIEESRAPACVILEDDAELSDDFAAVVHAVASRERDWDMVKLFARRRQAARTVGLPVSGHRLVRHLRQPTGTVGQMVSRAGAEKLLAHSARIYRPLDVQLQHWWEFDLRVLSVDPPIVREVSRTLGGSTLAPLRPRRRLERAWRTWKRALFRSGLLFKSVLHFGGSGWMKSP